MQRGLSNTRPQGGVLLGLAWGLGLGLLFLVAPVPWLDGELMRDLAMLASSPGEWLRDLVATNLQGSFLPFAAVLLFYGWQMLRLGQELRAQCPSVDRVSRRESLVDLSGSLFFGIGVVWTAIGMRDALLHSLGDPGLATRDSAFDVLRRLVDGGILVALSTTIVGSIGGYLMRIAKTLLLGGRINTLYYQASQEPVRDTLQALARIERLLPGEPHDPGA